MDNELNFRMNIKVTILFLSTINKCPVLVVRKKVDKEI
jgi:hypothetical protein